MNRKTALILLAAGALVAASLLLSAKKPTQAESVAIAVDPDTPPQENPAKPASFCGGPAQPASHKLSFGHGDLAAALSSQKILHNATGEMFLAIDLSAHDKEIAGRPDMSLAIVIDRSGSMAGDKIVQAKNAAIGIIDRLGVRDRVAVVQYDDSAQVILPSTTMDSAGKARARAKIDSIQDNGGTNLHDGLALGRDEVLKVAGQGTFNRVLLLSDGVANVGIVDTATLSQVASSAAEKGVRITTIGLGLDYNEDLMEALAEYGRGQYYYVKDGNDLQAVFTGELKNIQATVATNSELRLAPACEGVDIVEVYGYATRREGRDTLINMADIFGGDTRKIVARVKVPAGRLGMINVVRVTMSYDDAQSHQRKTVELAVGAEISADAVAVEQSANKDVVTAALEVESARAMREAADAYKRGDVAQATSINRAWRNKAQEQAAQYALPAAATDGLMGDLDQQANDIVQFDPGSSSGKAVIKGSKAKARELSKKKR